MCRFVAVVGREEFDPAPYVNEVSNMAREGKRSPHGDGWGIWIKNEKMEYLHKETVPIWEREIERFPKAKVLFVHARKRGKGARIAIENTHPFIWHDSVFMHNGIIKIEHGESSGDTDSEALFMHMMHRGIWNVLCEIEKYEFSSINSVLYNEGKIYAIRYAKKMEDYYTIFVRKESGRVVLSTEGGGEEIKNKSVVVIHPDLRVEVLPICPDMFR